MNNNLNSSNSETAYKYKPDYRVYTSGEGAYFDPSKQLVNNYTSDITTMYDNRGKYFDAYLFNKKFDEYINEENKLRLEKENVLLYDLNKTSNIQISPFDLPLNKILINVKNLWFNLFDNIMNGKNLFQDFNYNDLFYYGITLIVICILFLLLNTIFS